MLNWKLLERAHKIGTVVRQVVYVLAPSVKIEGEIRARPELRYTADFQYLDPATSLIVVEDVKGKPDTAFRIRQHLMKSVHGVDVRLT